MAMAAEMTAEKVFAFNAELNEKERINLASLTNNIEKFEVSISKDELNEFAKIEVPVNIAVKPEFEAVNAEMVSLKDSIILNSVDRSFDLNAKIS